MNTQTAIKLIEFARVKQDLGIHEEAALLYEQAIVNLRRQNPLPHKIVAIALNDLGLLQSSQGQHEEALAILHEALNLQRNIFDENHPEIASTYNNLGMVYRKLNRFDEARNHLIKAAERFATAGIISADTANIQNNLAVVCEALGENQTAYSYFNEALAQQRKIVGDTHPQLAVTLYNLAALCVAKLSDTPPFPLELMAEANGIDDQAIDTVFAHGSETGRLRFLGSRFPHYQLSLSYTWYQMQQGQPVPKAAAYNLVLRRKGLATEISAAKQTAVWQTNQPESSHLLTRLSSLRQQIAQQSISPRTPAAQIEPLIQEKERLEAQLARATPTFSIYRDFRLLTHEQIGKALPENSALVEFVRFEPYDFTAVLSNGDQRQHPSRYFVFVIQANQPEKFQLFDLGPAAAIEQQVNDICLLMGQAGRARNITGSNNLYLPALEPVWRAVSTCSRLFIAPDGDVSLISFAVLQRENGRFLIDDHTISYLMTGRDLVFPKPPSQYGGVPLIMANPDYGAGLSPTKHCSPLFQPLEWAAREGKEVAGLLGTQPISGKTATAQRLKTHQSPRVLHLATHGFFFPYFAPEENSGNHPGATLSPGLQRLSQNRSALLRSGLAFAGANRWACDQLSDKDPDTGILTAEEIRNLNLTGSELVVLSACDTAVGEALAGEAVFGFRRAFVVAGVRTVVMSLWKVPEHHTCTLMSHFYKNLLAGQSRAEALRQAQLYLKDNGVSPFGWGAFICQGSDEPMNF